MSARQDRPHISYILSSHDRKNHLACCIYSLLSQTDSNFEIIVIDNSKNAGMRETAQKISDDRVQYFSFPESAHCYESSNIGVHFSSGEYLCFPSDDSYYVPTFGEKMYGFAKEIDASFVFCDFVYGCEDYSYLIMDAKLSVNHIDKTTFIVRKKDFIPFNWKKSIFIPDGLMAEYYGLSGYVTGKVPEVLAFHN